MIEKVLHNILYKLGYTSSYFVSYRGKNGLLGSMTMTVKPYIISTNYDNVVEEVQKLAGEVAITCISKL